MEIDRPVTVKWQRDNMSQTGLVRDRSHLLSTGIQIGGGDQAKKNFENKDKIVLDMPEK